MSERGPSGIGRLLALELPVVATLAALSAASAAVTPWALVAALLFWGLRWAALRRLTVRTPADWALGLLVLASLGSLAVSALPEVTRPQVLWLLLGAGLLYATANWTTGAQRRQAVVLGLGAVGVGVALLAALTAPLLAGRLPPLPWGLGRSDVSAVNPNVLAGTLAWLLPLAAAPVLYRRALPGRLPRVALALGCAIMLGALVLTHSRGGLLATGAGLLLLVALRWRRGWLALPAGALVTGVVAWRLGFARLADLLSQSSALNGLDSRVEIWSRALYMIQDFPFTGIGMGTFRQIANLLYPFFLAGPDADIPHAHNLFLQVGVDLGLPGLIAWLAVLVLVLASALQVRRQALRSGDPWHAALGAGLVASMAALAVHGLTDAVTWGTRPAILVWIPWGLALGLLQARAGD